MNLFFYGRGSERREKPRNNSGPDRRMHYVEGLQITAIPEYKPQSANVRDLRLRHTQPGA